MSQPRILIADDSRDAREIYSLYLQMAGYDVETASDGREAVNKARARRPDLIVIDLAMPEVDGWKTMDELRRDITTADIPFIVLTGHDFKDYLKPAVLASGARSYLTKPCLPERLAREIAERLPRTGRPTASC